MVLCDDAHITQLNLEWRGQDGPTDVLSFEMPEDEDGAEARHLLPPSRSLCRSFFQAAGFVAAVGGGGSPARKPPWAAPPFLARRPGARHATPPCPELCPLAPLVPDPRSCL